jgi:formylglycine-generating enzyme required for sulfatase activity/predicted Ser/Thr protein kinase
MLTDGQVIGGYRLKKQLGCGAFGEVWLGEHAELGIERALKIPTDPQYIQQLRKEGRIQCSLHHPRVVQTFDLNTLHNPPYLVMEYVDGPNLRQHLRAKGKLPTDEALAILRQLLEVLAFGHAQGVLHRDLKPENILLTKDGQVKVTDFGLGKVQAEVAQSLVLSGSMMTKEGKSISGTFEYMSPEQRDGSESGPQDDLFAVGIIACELLTGKRPGALGLLRTLQRGGVTAELVAWMEKACDEREYRYATAAAMLDALGDGTKATEAVVAPPVIKPVARLPRAGQPCENSLGMKFVPVPGTNVLFSIWETRVQDFEAFVNATGHNADNGMYSLRSDRWKQCGDTWRNPGFTQGPTHPVCGVSWEDATAFCKWLTEKERDEGRLASNQEYRLPTDAEWSAAVGPTKYPWGDQWPPPAGAGNYAGEEARNADWPKDWGVIEGYRDGYARTSPVGSFKANQHGLYDMGGNVWELCKEWYRKEMNDPTLRKKLDFLNNDGGGKAYRVLRGASWINDEPDYLLSSYRNGGDPGDRGVCSGFRCVLVVASS